MKYYTVKQVAESTGYKEATIREWLKAGGKYPHAIKNGQWRIPQCCKDGHPEGVTEASEAAVAAAVSETEGRELSKTEKLKADTAEKEAVLQNIKVTADLEGWKEEQKSLIEGREALMQEQTAWAKEKEGLVKERQRLVARDTEVKGRAALVAKAVTRANTIIDEAKDKAGGVIAEAEAQAENLIASGKAEVESLVAEATETSNRVAESLATVAERAKEVDQRDFDTDQYRIIKSRIAALPDKVRAKHFPKADRAFLPLLNDKKMPVSDPDKSEPVAVDKGYAISGESRWDAGTCLWWGAIVAIFGWALWQWLKLIG